MQPAWLSEWIPKLEAEVIRAGLDEDPAHDLGHIRRVVRLGLWLARIEGADPAVVVPACYLHDIVNLPKNDPRRAKASTLAGEAAVEFLRREGYPEEYFDEIRQAIESHSYSAKIEPKSLAAECVQDADRLDALGAIGVVRCFAVGSGIKRRFYDLDDPFARLRPLDDLRYTLDHFYVKLFKIAETLRTKAGRLEGYRRLETMKQVMTQFEREILWEENT